MGKKHKNQSPQSIKDSDASCKDGQVERCTFLYEQTRGWIENADNKVSVSCGVFSAVFAATTFYIEHYLTIPQEAETIEAWQIVYTALLIGSVIVMLAAIVCYAVAIIPNLKSNSGNPLAIKFPIFYGDVSKMSIETYTEKMLSGNCDDFVNELIKENHLNSTVCNKKMRWYKWGVLLSLLAIALTLTRVAAHFFMYK
jgi:hypothetical protein